MARTERRLRAQRPDPLPSPAQPGAGPPPADRRLVVVAISHLDTQWRWTLRESIARHLPETVRENAARFAEFPRHVLSFDGAFRYRLLDEYYPDLLAEVRRFVGAGRWSVAGAFLDAADTNLPSPESLLRQVLYGNAYLARALGVCARDVFLPDSFGFSWALPSIAAHCGLELFSSQKLSRGRGAEPLPFDIGRWEGPDGATILAALNPSGYGEPLDIDLTSDPAWRDAVDRVGRASGESVGLKYFGVGDTGGAPDRASLARLERAIAEPAEMRVLAGSPARLLDELPPACRGGLPRHRGELLMAEHGTGCYTAHGAMKRWNRRNEQLADAAERAAVAAAWLGAAPYPRRRLGEAWQRFLVHQSHDDLTGTSVPAAYRYSWNDEALSLNQFAGVLTDSVGALSGCLDTRVDGTPLVVFNPLAMEREDVVDAVVPIASAAPVTVRVVGPDGAEVPAQARRLDCEQMQVVFVARMPACGCAVFAVVAAADPPGGLADSDLRVEPGLLAGPRLAARLDARGELESLRFAGRELLAEPARLEMLPDTSLRFPAWEIRYADVSAAPLDGFGAPSALRVIERGPARATVEVERRCDRSVVRQRFSLAAGAAGDHLECDLLVDWRGRGRLLKAAFPLSLDAPSATYDLGLGAIERPPNSPRRYEVPAQQWADLSDAACGCAILSDSRQGWDRPAAATLRLTLLHTPRVGHRFRYQRGLDVGRHRIRYAIAPHSGSWRDGEVPSRAARFNQPLVAFQVAPHAGPRGRVVSFAEVAGDRVAVRALKLAETSDEIVLRLQEIAGVAHPAVAVRFGDGLGAAREVNGQEQAIGPAAIAEGRLVVELGRFQPRSFALTALPPAERLVPPQVRTIELPFDRTVTSPDADRRRGRFDATRRSIPAELWPSELDLGGVRFALGPAAGPNALACREQRLALGGAAGARLHLVLAAAGGDRRVQMGLGETAVEVDVPDWREPVGLWERRRFGRRSAGYLKRCEVAWVGTHRHAPRGDEPYEFCYLFRQVLELPGLRGDAIDLQLPGDPRVLLFAASLVWDRDRAVAAASLLYD